MTRLPLLSIPLLSLIGLTACDSDSPIERSIGEGRIIAQVGPGGRTLRGDGGTALEGFLLDIPPGAVDRLIEVRIEPGRDIDLADTTAETISYAMSLRPDPGVLKRPAILEVFVDLPVFRRPEDLVVVSRPTAERPSALRADGGERLKIAAESGVYDRDSGFYTAEIGSLGDLQVRNLRRTRLPEDSIRLVQLGFESLSRLTDASLREADQLFAEAQRADPFSAAANLFRAISRVLVIANDRSDDTPALDSVGEALQRIGFDVASRSLVSRLRTGIWPSRFEVPPDAPSDGEIVAMLRTRVVPALELAIRDLDHVPDTVELLLVLPPLFRQLPGDRELDVADLLLFRSLLAGAVATIELAGDFELDIDAAALTRRGVEPPSLQRALDLNPDFGRVREPVDDRTMEALRAALLLWREAFDAIVAEDDQQDDDLVVLPSSLGAADFDRWRNNLRGLSAALEGGGDARLLLAGGGDSLLVSPRAPLQSGAVDPRALLPDVFRFLPIAGTLADPTAGGLFPGLDQARATELLQLYDVAVGPTATIVADGEFADWPAGARALRPDDPIGDAGAGTGLRGVDIESVWFAQSPDELAFRIDVADGEVAFRTSQASAYRFRIETVEPRGFGRRIDVEVVPTAQEFEIRVGRDGVPASVRASAAARDGRLEVVLDRFQLLGPDEPVADRAVHVASEAIGLQSSERARDETRGFLTRF